MQMKKCFVISGLVFLLSKVAYAQNNNAHDAIDSHAMNNLTPTTVTQVEEIKEQLRSVRGELEKLQFENAKLNEKLTKFAADVELRFSELSKPNVVPDNSIFHSVDQPHAQPDATDIKPTHQPGLHHHAAPAPEHKNHQDTDVKPTHHEDAKKPEAKKHEKEAIKESKKEITKEGTKEAVESTAKIDKKAKDKMIHDQYQEAYSLLKNHDYKKAQDSFQKFVTEHPDSELIGSAYYWLGETYFTKNEFNNAAMNYLKGYQNNSKGSRAADNLLKLSKSLSKLEKNKEACTSLLKLKQDFPSASETIKKQVAEDISSLKCSS